MNQLSTNRTFPFERRGGRSRPSGDGGSSSADILAAHARTSFNFAARFLPPDQRRSATDLYAFFRTLDDLVDESIWEVPEPDIRAEFGSWRDWLQGSRRDRGPREPLASDLSQVIDTYNIPVSVFLHLIDGLESDLGPREIETELELRTYCYQVASTVGFAMAHVLGATSPQALAAAESLGAAMQLTNILRDVGEDLLAKRVYLPTVTLAHYGLSREDLTALQRERGGPDDRFRDLMRSQIARAHAMYDASMPGIWLLPPSCRLPILIAARLYRRLLTIIERNDYDTLRRRASTSRRDKLQEAITAWTLVSLWHSGEQRSPETPHALPTSRLLEAQGD